jgi:membrane-anchored protein YejM (alkaline phosphatase superfamily)
LAKDGFIANWGRTAAAGTCSELSNALLYHGLPPLPDPDNRRFQNPTIFQYAQAMGYETYFFDAQANYLWNDMRYDDLVHVDHWLNIDTLGDNREADFRVAEQVQALLAEKSGLFIAINKRGTHFHYNDVFPASEAVWTPIPADPTNYEDPNMVKNSYDNAILYNNEHFFRNLLPDTSILENSIMVYTGDHGETLGEGNRDAPHCGDSLVEANVPLLLIGQALPPLDTTFAAGHINIFATLLDLMNVPMSARLHDYPISLLKATAADSQPRTFLSGSNMVVPFDE